MKNINIKKNYVVLMLLTLVVGVGAITFAYFQGNVLNDLINTTGVTTGNINIQISDNSVNATNVKPLYTADDEYVYEESSFAKKFTITNDTNSLNVCTDLYMRINSIDDALKNEYFKYIVVDDDTGYAVGGNFSSVSKGDEVLVGPLYFFGSGVTKSYTMYVWIEYSNDVDQINMLNKTLNATLFIKAKDMKDEDSCDTRTTRTLTYKTNNGEVENKKVVFNKGDSITNALSWNPYSSDKILLGWYKDPKFTTKITSAVINSDIKVYGQWAEIDNSYSIGSINNLTCTRSASKKLGTSDVISWDFTGGTIGLTGKYFCVLDNNESLLKCDWITSYTHTFGFVDSTSDKTYYVFILSGEKDRINNKYSVTCKTNSGGSGNGGETI